MDKVIVKDFRCFKGSHSARLALLTLLVGENSTGKTSLMAMITILWHVVFLGVQRPNFREAPFDLGSFQDIAHQSTRRGKIKDQFSVGLSFNNINVTATFHQGKISVEVYSLQVTNSETSITWTRCKDDHVKLEVKNPKGTWQYNSEEIESRQPSFRARSHSNFWGLMSIRDFINLNNLNDQDPSQPTHQDITEWENLALSPFNSILDKSSNQPLFTVAHSIAPVRADPRRIYEPGPGILDSKGGGIPEYLAAIRYSDKNLWKSIKSNIEKQAKATGLFDEFRIRPLGDDTRDTPFQIQVRKNTKSDKGQWRNLVDVGQGVSQLLPLIFELSRPVESPLLLLQQPEVHLHPSAQAGLGSVLCEVASTNRQILVETHSDHLIDRIRMDVRDEKTELKPEDVSILYFERGSKGVNIYNIRIDEDGNIIDQPPSYRKFFRHELDRSLGI